MQNPGKGWDDTSGLTLAMAFQALFLSNDFSSPALHLFPLVLLSLAGSGPVSLRPGSELRPFGHSQSVSSPGMELPSSTSAELLPTPGQ